MAKTLSPQQRGALTRAKNRAKAEREARALAKRRSEAATRGAITRAKNRAKAEREAKKRSRTAKKGAETRRRKKEAERKILEEAAERQILEKLRRPILEEPPQRAAILSVFSAVEELLEFAASTPRFHLEELQNLRYEGGHVLADTPAGRTFRFYTVETDGGMTGYWTSAKTFDVRLSPEAVESYEDLNKPDVVLESEWEFS